MNVKSAIATIVIGVAALSVAVVQLILSSRKLRLDLFEKRFTVFMKMREFASAIALGQAFDPGELYRGTIERKFIFDSKSKVLPYFDQMYDKANELQRIDLELHGQPHLVPLEEGRNRELQTSRTAIKVWFERQGDEMFSVFQKELSVRTLKRL